MACSQSNARRTSRATVAMASEPSTRKASRAARKSVRASIAVTWAGRGMSVGPGRAGDGRWYQCTARGVPAATGGPRPGADSRVWFVVPASAGAWTEDRLKRDSNEGGLFVGVPPLAGPFARPPEGGTTNQPANTAAAQVLQVTAP